MVFGIRSYSPVTWCSIIVAFLDTIKKLEKSWPERTLVAGADPGFVARGSVSRRVQWVQGRAPVGGSGGPSPPEALGV